MARNRNHSPHPARRAAAVLVGLVLIVLVAGERYEMRGHLDVDACLDAGGSWDSQAALCHLSPRASRAGE